MKIIDKIKKYCDGKIPSHIKDLRLCFNKKGNKLQGLNEDGNPVWTIPIQVDNNENGRLLFLFHIKNHLAIIEEDEH